MAAGLPRNRVDIDQRAGTLAVTVRNAFDEVDRFQSFLSTIPDAELEAAPFNYTPTEVAQMKSAFADLARLGAVYRGQQGGGTAYDFRTFANLLTGVL
jgi:thiamine biosynthesis lipoprotein ApbE